MGDNYCSTVASFDKVEEHKDRQAVDYIFTDQAPDSLEEDSAPNPGSAEPPRNRETNDFLKRLLSFFSLPSWRGRPK